MERRSNSIGYVYHELGIIAEEKAESLPYLRQVLQYFDIVEDVKGADVVAFGVAIVSKKSFIVIHMAKLNEDKESVTHRRKFGKSATVESLESLVDSYHALWGDDAHLFYLKRKQ